MPVVALLVIIAAAAAWKKLEGAAAHALVFAAGSMTLAVATLVVGHRLAGVPYPFGRTGLYLAWLGLAAWLAAMRAPAWSGAFRIVPWVLGLTLAVLGVRFVTLTNSKLYLEFPEHGEVKQALRQVREVQGAAPKPAQVGGSWEYISGLNYYRLRYRLRWMSEVGHGGLKEGFDYYVLTAADGEWVEKLRLRKVWTGPRTGIIVAVPGG